MTSDLRTKLIKNILNKISVEDFYGNTETYPILDNEGRPTEAFEIVINFTILEVVKIARTFRQEIDGDPWNSGYNTAVREITKAILSLVESSDAD